MFRRDETKCFGLLALAISLVAVGSIRAQPVRFRKIVLDKTFRSEGVAVGDVNRDGKLDVLAGEVWYEQPQAVSISGAAPGPWSDARRQGGQDLGREGAAPDWEMHEILPPGQYDYKTGYSKTFANFACDVNGDGWIDSVITTMMGEPSLWYENPQGKPGHWKVHTGTRSACNETPLFADLLGNGKPVAIWGVQPEGYIAWFSIPQDPYQLWNMHIIAGPKAPGSQRYDHGLGVGDINGDGRNDVITSSAHDYGIWWFEQLPGGKFQRHEISKNISQTHALRLADLNGDGIMDFVTGKRYFAHNGKDPGAFEPALLVWFEIQRPEKGKVQFVQHAIDDDSGIGTQFEVVDLNGDGLLDIVTANKKGVHVFLQEGPPQTIALFDGKTFDGWEGNLDYFRIEDGAIVGGSLDKAIPRNEFLCTKKEYGDFELRLKVKLLGDLARANAGIQIRSRRIPNHHEMIGYQADMGQKYWGCLYDESRRNKILAQPDAETLQKALKPGAWNDYVIRCTGRRVQLWLNGVQTVDYTEPDTVLEQTGLIGLQIHSGPPSEAWYKDITITPLRPGKSYGISQVLRR